MTLYLTPRTRRMWRSPMMRYATEAAWPEVRVSDVFFPIDVKAEAEGYEITAVIPGVKSEDIHIQVEGEMVSIQGEFKVERDENASYLLQERPTGKFSRVLNLPAELDASRAEAQFEAGVLTLRVPKAESARPKVIKVVAK